MCENFVWVFLSAYLDEISRQDKYYKITNINKGKYHKIIVIRTKFQPTWFSHPH